MARALEATLCVLAALPAAGDASLRIDVAARALAPGEPLRVVVAPSAPLVSLDGSFLDEPFSFHPSEPDPDRGAPIWSGWTMVGLDERPGPATIEVRGRTADGEGVAGELALEIVDKSFPSEELTVAPSYVEPPAEVLERLAAERALLADLYRARNPLGGSGEPFVRPVPGERTSVFGTRRVYNGKPRDPHPGLDLRAAEGSEVLCSGPGRVVLARDLYYSGNTVLVDHGGGLFTIYAHLSEFRVSEGDEVHAGRILGLSGATGRVTGPHLHWGAKIGNRPFDPAALLDPALWRWER